MNRRVTLVLSLVLASSLPAADEPPKPVSPEQAQKAKQSFESARLLLFKGEFDGAVTLLEEAVKADPTKLSYQLMLAKAHRFAGQTSKAVDVLEGILEQQPDHLQAGIELAEMLMPGKEPDRVIKVLEPLLRFRRDYPLYHLLAEAHYRKRQLDQARGYFEDAIKLNDRNSADHYQLGNIYLAQKRLANAAGAYEKAGELGFSSPVYHFKLASVYFNLHNYLGKLELVEVIDGKPGEVVNDRLLIDPVPGSPHRFRAAGPRSAVFQAARARAKDVNSFALDFLQANIWLRAGMFERAEALYGPLEADVPKDEAGAYWYQRAQAALGLRKYEQYLGHLNRAIEAEPQTYRPALGEALITVANRHQQQGDAEKHVEYLARAMALNPISSRLHLALADAYWLKKDREKAIQQYKMVLELEPEFPFRVQILNRIQGQEESNVAIGTATTPRLFTAVPGKLDLAKARCPVTGQPVVDTIKADHAGGTVFFASTQAVDAFKGNPKQFEIKANYQLFVTKQAQAQVCPLTSRRLNPTITARVDEVDVPLCCKGCQGRVNRAEVAEKMNLLFAADSFKDHYKVTPLAP